MQMVVTGAQLAVCTPEMMLTGVMMGFQRQMRGNQQGITETSVSPGMTSWESMRPSTAQHPTFQGGSNLTSYGNMLDILRINTFAGITCYISCYSPHLKLTNNLQTVMCILFSLWF